MNQESNNAAKGTVASNVVESKATSELNAAPSLGPFYLEHDQNNPAIIELWHGDHMLARPVPAQADELLAYLNSLAALVAERDVLRVALGNLIEACRPRFTAGRLLQGVRCPNQSDVDAAAAALEAKPATASPKAGTSPTVE